MFIMLLAYAALAIAGLLACRKLRVRPDGWSIGLGTLLSALQLVGVTYRDSGTWRALVATPAAALASLLGLALGALALSLACRLAFWLMDEAAPLRGDGTDGAAGDAVGGAAGDVPAPVPARFPPTPAVMAMLLAAWLPYLLTFWPGSLTYDGTYQLDVFYGWLPTNDHHPYLMTLLMGTVVDLGRRLGGSDGAGVALWVCLQTLVQAAAFSLSVRSMRRTGAPTPLLAVATAFFALAPAWGAYAQALCKDTLYASLFCLYATLLLEVWVRDRRGEGVSWAQAGALLALGIGLCLVRHDGAAVVVLALPAALLALSPGRARRLVAGAAAAAIAVELVVSSVLLPALGVAAGGRQESLGPLFQMTARYLVESPDDVEDWEREAIEAVLDYDSLAELYDPTTSDPVKATYHGTDADLPSYLAAWVSMGLRHPGVYLDAFLASCYGYLYLDTAPTHHTWDYRIYQSDPIVGSTDTLDVSYAASEDVRATFISALNTFQGLPVLGLVGHCGLYAWALLLAAVHGLRASGRRGLIVAAPSLVVLLICLASPVNGYVRYMLPIMAATPVVLWASCVAGVGCGSGGTLPAPRHGAKMRRQR